MVDPLSLDCVTGILAIFGHATELGVIQHRGEAYDGLAPNLPRAVGGFARRDGRRRTERTAVSGLLAVEDLVDPRVNVGGERRDVTSLSDAHEEVGENTGCFDIGPLRRCRREPGVACGGGDRLSDLVGSD